MKPWTSALSRLQLPAWLLDAQRTASAHWQRRTPREKRLLMIGMTTAGVVLIWLTLFDPALKTATRLHRTLPELRAQAAQLDAVIQEANDLKLVTGAHASAPNNNDLYRALVDSLQRNSLGDGHNVQSTTTGEWTITVQNAAIDVWLDWLQMAAAELRLLPVQVDLHAAQDDDGRIVPGRVSGTIQMARYDRDPT